MAENDKVKLRHSVLNEIRVNIINQLLDKAQNISDLEKRIKNINRSTICYHLNILEDAEILESEYQILQSAHSKGRAARVYSINRDKLTEAIKAIDELKEEIKS